MARTHLQLLGRFQVRCGGEEVPPAAFGGRKVRSLVRLLAVRRPDLVPHLVLAEALWPDRLPADPVANLNVLVNRARRAVGDPDLIITGTGGYALGDAVVDIAEFEAAVDRARRAERPAEALREASEALRMWGEPLAEDSYADWAGEPRERLRRAYVDALEIAARSALRVGDPRAAVHVASDAVAAEPLRESAAVVLATAQSAAGDRAAALDTLAGLRARLADELGVDPGAEADELYVALLRGSAPAPPSRPVPMPSTGPAFTTLAFTGRADELAAIREAAAHRRVVAVAGAAGIGKSRLAEEALRTVALPVIAARAFLAERAEAWSLARTLLQEAAAADHAAVDELPARLRAALADLLPELPPGPADALDGESRRALLLTGAVRMLERVTGEGAVLVVDDLQWADPSSVVLLGSVLARLPRLAVVLAYRPDEIDPGALASVTAARAVTTLRLGPLGHRELEELVGDAELAGALAAATDGTPFAVSEVLRELVRRDAVTAGPAGWVPGPAAARLAGELGRDGQRRAIRRRAGRQPARRAELLGLVALLAREAPAGVLAVAGGRTQREVLDDLSELARAGLLRLGEQGWAPAHDLVGETVGADLDDGERGRLHGLLAAALESGGADPAEIARHHREAGDHTAAAAAYARSAQRALAAHATREAHALAGTGLALAPSPQVRVDLLDVRAEARAVHGDVAGAVEDLHAGLAEPVGGRSRRLARLAMFTSGARDLRRAGELAELSVVEAGGDPAQRAFALETAAILDMNLDRPERAAQRSEEALALYRGLGDARGVARILDGRAMAVFLDGRVGEGVELFGRVAQLFEDSGDLVRVVTPRSTRGHGLTLAGRPQAGVEEAGAALRLARELDVPEGQAYALWHRSESLSALGRTDEALADAREALRLATAAGHRGWTATAHRASGLAMQAAGDLDAAGREFAASAQVAGDALGLFASWAAARSALVWLLRGEPERARPLVDRALGLGPPLGHHEARLAQVELAAATGAPECTELANAALGQGKADGYLQHVPRLEDLAGIRG